MPRALIDRDIQPTELLVDALDPAVDPTIGADGATLIDDLEGMDVLCATSRLQVTAEVIAASDLQVIGKLGTGIDNVDLEAAAAAGIPVTYTPGLNAMAVAEHALGLALAVLRQTPVLEQILADGHWRDATPLGTELVGKTVGIIGFGNIGQRFAGLLAGFHTDLLVYDPYIRPEDTQVVGARQVDLDTLLQDSDLVSVHAALTPETRGMLDAAAFAQMAPAAVVVNTARGPIIDEAALIDAIDAGTIAGAGLDVFASEPLDPASRLHELERVITTPHSAARTTEAAAATIHQLAANVNALLDGQPVPERYLATPTA
jgi:Phosphoglycerate dehydrogenase and related dehydrogenases